MNNKNIDNLIPVAMRLLSEGKTAILNTHDFSIKSNYNTYIASLGPSIRQAGMLKTLAFYSRKDVDAERYKVSDFVLKVLIEGKIFSSKYTGSSLLDVYLGLTREKPGIERLTINNRILEAIVACKLSAATFRIEKIKEQ